jgi:hypothetical protein
MQHIIDLLREQKESLLSEALRIEDAITILSDQTVKVNVKPDIMAMLTKGKKEPGEVISRGRNSTNSPLNGTPGTKVQTVNKALEDFLKNHGPASSVIVCEHLRKAGILKRGRELNISAYVDKKTFYRNRDKKWAIR